MSTDNTTVEQSDAAPAPTPEAAVEASGGPEPGIFWKATIKTIGDEKIEVSLGDEVGGYFPRREAIAADKSMMVSPGDEVEVLLDILEGEQWVVSMEKAEKVRVFERLVSLAKSKAHVQGVITRQVRGGFSVDIGVRAFLPGRESGYRRSEAASAVGQTVECQVQRFDRKKGEVVLTRRALAEAAEAERKAAIYEKLEIGAKVTGTVRSLTKFGAFVDIGGVDGLLHVAEMAWSRVNKPGDVVSVGDDVEVQIIQIDPERDRIGLSRKALLENPWELFAEANPAGTKLSGTVTSVTDFGAFVKVQDGVEGLVHISELSWDRSVQNPSEVVSKGDEVDVVVKDVDIAGERLSLSIKRLQPNPWTVALENIEVGAKIQAKVTNVVDFGVFLEVVPGVEGLLHVSDMSWTERVEKPNSFREFNEGDEVEVMVLTIDSDRNRISLGIKQLEQDPWDSVGEQLKVGGTLQVTISRIADFGAFAKLADGLEGLIHVSEMSTDRVERIEDVIAVNQEVTVQVIEADRKRRKVGLSIKAHLEGQGAGMKSYTDDGSVNTSLGALLAARGIVEDEPEQEPAAEDAAVEAAPAEEAPIEEASAEEAAVEEAAVEEAAAEEAAAEEAPAEEAPAEDASADDAGGDAEAKGDGE